MTTLAEYNARALEARIAKAKLPPEQTKLRQLIYDECLRIIQATGWALDPEEDYPGDMARSVVESAHTLLDLAHEFKQAVKR